MSNGVKKICLGLGVFFAVCLLAPAVVLAAGPKTISGTVVRFAGSGVVITNGTAASYLAELSHAALTRKNGASMAFSEILVGDKMQVTGTLWNDNSISATAARDLSLYAHTGTFSGKITGINPQSLSFTMQGTANGSQAITTNNFTSFTKNKAAATFNDLELGMSVTVKGEWDRSKANVLAGQVQGMLRLVNIDFSGALYAVNGNSITVIGNGNVIYGVDLSKAKLQDKSGKTVLPAQLNIGDVLSVHGEHVSGSVKINAFTVKVTKPVK